MVTVEYKHYSSLRHRRSPPHPVAGIGSLSFSRAGTGMDAGIDPDDAEEISGGTLLSYHRYYAAGLLIWKRQRRQRPGL